MGSVSDRASGRKIENSASHAASDPRPDYGLGGLGFWLYGRGLGVQDKGLGFIGRLGAYGLRQDGVLGFRTPA